MTSSRSTPRPRVFRKVLVIALCVLAFAVALIAWFTLSPVRQDPESARQATQRSLALLKADNATAARDEALAAVRSDPGSPEPHIALTLAMLALDDGVGAEAEVQRAVEAGYDAKLVPHLRAHAQLLQGEEEKALAELDKADPRFRTYALRIRARALTGLGNLPGALAALNAAMQIAPQDSEVWTDMGRFKYAAGDLLGAIAASEQAVKLAPGNIDALQLRGELVRGQYGLVASLPWFESALKRDPARHDILIEYAATLGDVGRTVDALAVTRRALEVRPGSPEALYLQAVIAARAGKFDLARSLMEKTRGGVASLPGAMLLGSTLDIQAGDYQQAIEKLRTLVNNQPMNITARKLLAVALLRTDSARNAIDMLRPVVARNDADSYALTLVARGFERIGDRANAARFLDRAAYPAIGEPGAFSADDSVAVLAGDAALRPGDPGATVPLIRALIDQGNLPGALAKAQEIAAGNRGAPAAHILVGDTLMLLDRYGDAATAYRTAADLRFDEPTMLRLVESLERAGRRGDAANVLALFLSQNPVNTAALRLSAHWQLVAGDYDAAIDSLETLRARIGDGDAALNTDLAAAYTGAGETATAIEFGEAAYGLAPANPAVADAFGWALYRSGDLPGALELLQKAVVLAPRHPGLRWHLAQVYADLNRKAEARTQAQAALADPGFTERAAATALVAGTG
ncbi:tetratricopeptide repeat protein [Sphingomonas sp. M1-B02]|uniref:tetratricopeptide repeat protein n=1 Tax=Sphingomonas sp. M1-B02 TaxID=3114300 RepID=UPI00223F53E9|nr:tetratricopeptide repeat protein [Sphingomonas sp. S6-11]UZK65664.1 tetratricopeptide repeat protein [Sphingomonas sp. S6-11]